MNKLELVEALREEAGITKNEAEVVVNTVFDEMSNAMANGDRVEIKPKKLPFFKFGKELKERVDK